MDDALKKLLGLPNVESVETLDDTVPIDPLTIVMLGVPREAVERGHIETYLREFDKYGKRKMRSQVMLVFDGYDLDSRELYQIPEVRKWVNRLYVNVPHLFYFLTAENYNIRIVYLCLVELGGRQGEQVSIEPAGAKRLVEKISRNAVSFAKTSKESEAVQFVVANTILAETGYDQL